MNPYWGVNFFEFFQVLFSRLFSGAFTEIASDEVQIAVLGCIAISCGILGPFLVLKKMTMFANSLSHTILLGIVMSFLCFGSFAFDLSHLLLGALISALLTAILTEGLIQWFRLTEDASIGLIFTFLFALGMLLVTLFFKDVHLGIESVMGNGDALQKSDLKIAGFLVLLNGSIIALFYRQLQMASFDNNYAKCLGLPSRFFHSLLLILTAITCTGAFRAVGVLLVLAFLVGPYLTARLFCNRLKPLLLFSASIGLFAVVCGVALARHLLSEYDLPLSTGGIVVCFIGFFYFLGLAMKNFRVISLFSRKKLCYPGENS